MTTPAAQIALEVFSGIVDAGSSTGAGQPFTGTLRGAPITTGQGYSETTTPADPQTVTLVKSMFEAREIDGTLIQANDLRFLVASVNGSGVFIDPAPTTGDTLEVGGTTYQVKRVKTTAPGGIAVLYDLQVRA